MAVESIFYSVAGFSCRGALVWEEGVKASRPLLLMAPNWRGVIKPAIETAHMLAQQGYVVFVADMFGEGHGPVGTEDPMQFLQPFMADVPGMRRRIAAALDTLTREADRRAIGDVTRRAAIGYCFGGLNVLDLARSGADVQVVVSMHGTLVTPIPAKRGDIKAAVLAVHGAADPIAPKAERDAFEAEMTAAGARWALLTFGDVVHAFTDAQANNAGVAVYNETATRHGYALAHAFIADAFAGRL
jgi:dienelactone hydrolase